ncbi:hypothetical protein [Vibrio ishigakensis]|uniref:hypothetical protein n=1 Tax=Vibrio ishigakensis TaxID=1481914 RepID=UPI0021C2AE3F|nr:hypothetical protein [Vibrio ishigakensis]
MMARKLIVAFALCILPVSFLHADEISLPESQVVDNQTLSSMRGGFQIGGDYIVDIGISIAAAVNGENIYRTTIANLVFKNGTLTSTGGTSVGNEPVPANLVNVVQVGEGNVIENPPSPEAPTPGIVDSSVINIIQNTVDNSVIGINTIVDIDARVDSINKQIQADLRLKDALLNHRQ